MGGLFLFSMDDYVAVLLNDLKGPLRLPLWVHSLEGHWLEHLQKRTHRTPQLRSVGEQVQFFYHVGGAFQGAFRIGHLVAALEVRKPNDQIHLDCHICK